ncbi:MAG: Sensory box histidine kinase/response regulator [Myxococcaceae bacterium]|nr:Sensory box histidine kinase/response regulator [Myxococcaceae bacterium]
MLGGAPITDDLPVGVWVARVPGGELVYANKRFAEILGIGGRSDVTAGDGYASPYGIRTRSGELYPENDMPFARAIRARCTVIVDDIVIHRHDGAKVNIRAEARPVFDEAGVMTQVVIAFIDITREIEAEVGRNESEARLHQAMRMESIGNLAGGVAHDFNNLLGAQKLLVSMLRRLDEDPLRSSYLQQIDQITDSATELTRALLGFARRGKHLAQRVSLNDAARSVAALVERVVDRRIAVVTELQAESGDIIGDMSQLEQVLMNLAMNARDVMPSGGTMTIRTRDVGDAVVLEVTDTGPGIEPSIRGRIFEPYFSTKTVGETSGMGLGLATVYGIVETHGGRIEVVDGVPSGTTMRVVFPCAPAYVPRPTEVPPVSHLRRGSGTVLVVDDEAAVREASEQALRHLGYDVLAVESGARAIEIFAERGDEIFAVVLDMVMPGKDGRATYLELRKINPEVRVLLTTGYALNDEAQRILDLGVRGFIPKPFTMESLSEALAQLAVA